MCRRNLTFIVVFTILVSSFAPVALASDGTPLADAGLDQHVTTGTTVFLDGMGSRDPDGRIVTYEWNIETPSGQHISPTSPESPRTTFVPTTVGRYRVTLVVTDDDGRTAADTLFVTVEQASTPTQRGTTQTSTETQTSTTDTPANTQTTVSITTSRTTTQQTRTPPSTTTIPTEEEPTEPPGTQTTQGPGDSCSADQVRISGLGCIDRVDVERSDRGYGPIVDISGPDTVVAGETASFTAIGGDPDGVIEEYSWTVTGSRRSFDSQGLTGGGASLRHTFSRSDAGETVAIRVTVVDDSGQRSTASETVTVVGRAVTPTVELDGPSEVWEHQEYEYSVKIRGGTVGVERIEWLGVAGTGRSTRVSWDLVDGTTGNTEKIGVEVYFENGERLEMWKVVTIEKVDTRRFGEIDTTPDAGLLLELAEEVDQALTGKEERFADDLRGKDFGEAADLDILDARDRREARGLPSTADHADPGPADVDFVQPATDGLLDDLGQGLAQTSRIAGRADSTVEQSAERVGSAADRKLSQGAEETGSVVERAGEQAGRAIATGGSATATAVETTGETADQHAETFGRVVGASNGVATEAVTAVVDVAAEPAGDTVATAVRTTSGGVGGATAAVGDGAGAVAESAGDRAGDAVKHTTKVAGEVASAPLDVVEQAATIQRQATEAAEKTVDDLLGGL